MLIYCQRWAGTLTNSRCLMAKSLFIVLYVWFSLISPLISYSSSLLLKGHCHCVRIHCFSIAIWPDDKSEVSVCCLLPRFHSEQWLKTFLSFRARDDVSSLLTCRLEIKKYSIAVKVLFFSETWEHCNNLKFILPEFLLFSLKDLRYFLPINFLCFLVLKH